ncbi:glycoside hydrolase family 3 C-terminal domain-containing protein [Spirochaeta isovalerica]|uniref:Beta-glucosidase n=1 Tax=Spirochaeta isovalerica TaxID=150 RepID=A0A841RJK1_9SPIO|nr:glycoside hydrolase family 3 C-terminal domain-containing protein [Spirochaeta isovalerica]MBB6482472.1 beta-glucosidase [Spirochaeta isovalerica]
MNEKIDKLMKELTLEEKASLCSGKDFWNLEGIDRLNIPSIMVTDGPHGLRKQAGSGDHVGLGDSVPATCFPTAVALASSWDRNLLEEVGVALGEECLQEKVSVLLGPGINIKRNPLCGRNFEYFSEDPYIAGELAASLINGVQSKGIGTSLKHFAANNQEFCRMTIDTVVDERTLRELYLGGFEKAVKQSQPWTVMNAYNQINGEFCSESKTLLTNILKEEWGHEGLVVTDWGATNDRVEGIKAGEELEMPGNGGINDRRIVAAVKSGDLDESVLDLRVRRILELILKAEPVLSDEYSYSEDEHHNLAVNVAEQSIVLLKNENNRLPLKKKGMIGIIGDFAENPRYQGAGSSMIKPTKLDSALKAFENAAGNDFTVKYAKGFNTKMDIIEDHLIKEAVTLASQSDQTVIFAGLPPAFESEGFDRKHMSLPQNQLKLIDAVLAVDSKAVVVLSNGSPIELPFIDRCEAIVESYLSGQGGGTAVKNVLLGEVNPSGKIAETFPRELKDVPSNRYFPGSTKQVLYKEGLYVGYRYFDRADKEVLFPFGHGLSYTSFSYSDIRLPKKKIGDNETINVSCKVKNTGSRTGKEIVQLYVRDVESTVYRPEKELKGFEKVELAAGEEKEITFVLDRRSFAFYDTVSRVWQVEPGEFEILIGASSRDIKLRESLSVESDYTAVESDADRIYREVVYNIENISNRDFEKLLGTPVPQESPITPYHRNSTIADISRTFIGRQMKKQIAKNFTQSFGEMDDSTRLMVESMVNEMPLRSLAMMGGDKFTENMLEGLLLMTNGKLFRGLLLFLKK